MIVEPLQPHCRRAGPVTTLDHMGERWLDPMPEPKRVTTPEERGEILIDLLDLTDAPPPVPKRPLEAPTFAELCERR
jgi:hypothetical protein